MKLEINLVTGTGIFIDRLRTEVKNDTEALSSIVKFINNHASEFTARLTDQKFVGRLQSLSALTIDGYSLLRYILQQSNLDIIAFYVSNAETTNAEELPEGVIEYNVLDRNNIIGNFLPMCSKITKVRSELKLSEVYSKIFEMYGLISNDLLTGMSIPFKKAIEKMAGSEDSGLGWNQTDATMIKMTLDTLNKEIYLIRS